MGSLIHGCLVWKLAEQVEYCITYAAFHFQVFFKINLLHIHQETQADIFISTLSILAGNWKLPNAHQQENEQLQLISEILLYSQEQHHVLILAT